MPKVILVNFDDASPNIFPHVPQAQALAADGFRFRNNFINNPVCSPSRAATLTGKHAHNNGTLQNGGEDGSYEAFLRNDNEDQSLFSLAADLGAKVGMIGKYINGYGPDADSGPGFSYPALHVPQGVTEWFAPAGGYQGFNYEATSKTTGAATKVVATGNLEGNYLTQIISDRAYGFLGRRAADDFVLILNPYATHTNIAKDPEYPHTPYNYSYPPGPKFRPLSPTRPDQWSDTVDFPQTGNMGDGPFPWPDPVGALWHNTRPRRAPAWFRPGKLATSTLLQYQAYHQQRLMMAAGVNAMITRLKARAVELGIDDEIWWILTTDNGYHLGEHELPTGKGTPYDYDTRLPLIIRPAGGSPSPGNVDAIVQNVDLLPTILKILDPNASIPNDIDGRSLLGLIGEGPAITPWRKTALMSYKDIRWADALGGGLPPDWYGLASATKRFVDYDPDNTAVKPADRGEFYDVAADPWELANRWPEVDGESAEDFQDIVNDYLASSGAACWAVGLREMPTPTFVTPPEEEPGARPTLTTYVDNWLLNDYLVGGGITFDSDIAGPPPTRGVNLTVPASTGTVWQSTKVHDENTGSIDMWHRDEAALDRAVRLFGGAPRHLTEVVQTRGADSRRYELEVKTGSKMKVRPFGDKNWHVYFDYVAPKAYWEDAEEIIQTLPLKQPGALLVFDAFNGCQGPIEDAVITITGRCKAPHVECEISGNYFEYDGSVGEDGYLIATCAREERSVLVYSGGDDTLTEVIDQVDQDPPGPLLKLWPKLDYENGAIRIRVNCEEVRNNTTVTLRGRRKYFRGP